MATILSLALKVNADASGVVKNLTPAERALEKLAGQAEKATSVFDELAKESLAGADAQARFSDELAYLVEQLEDGLRPEVFAEKFAQLTDEINKEAAAFKRAAEITKANISPLERYDQTVAELDDQLRAGRISQETYNRALEKAKGDLDKTSTAVAKTDKSMESLAKNTKILAGIEIGRLFLDGLSAIGNVFQDIGSRVTSLVTSVNSSLDTLGDFSARTGVSVEALQGYSLAAKLAGVDTEQFLGAVQKLAVNIGKATPGDALDKSLRGINLSLQELRGLSPEDQFSTIGQAISELPTVADRAAAAVEIFGKQGAALAPLFADGIGSLKELEAEGRKLGAIVSDVQVGNVDEMNKAFDKVRATVQGIVGQVLGNLAPAVTDVTNQFLDFVKTWEGTGTQGTGGNGIANAITDVLLQGAEYFAGIFDVFVGNFSGVIVSAESVASTFTSVAQGLLGLSETFRAVFNIFQLAGNALSVALGKLLEAVGKYVSKDLKEYGAELQRQAKLATQQNSRDLEDAASRAGQAFGGMITGGAADAGAAGQGAAASYMSGLRDEIRQQRLPEFKVELNLGNAQERLDAYFKKAEDGGSVFFQQSADTVAKFQEMAAAGGLTADQIQIMNGFMKNLNAELDQELAKRQEAADAAAAQADADRKRLDQLMETKDEGARIENDLLTVQREQARVSEQLAAARASGNQAEADSAAARQAELDQLTAKLEEEQQALEQGFGDGFNAAFQSVDENISQLVAKSEEFGQAGFDAALRLQEGIAAAQQQARDGILNAEAFNAEVQRQQELFNQELSNIEEAEKARDAAAEDRKTKEKERQDAELQAQEEYRKQQETALQAYQQQQQKAQEAYAQEQAKIFEEQRKAAEAEASRQEERIRKLNTLGQQSISVADIRNTESANLVLQLGAAAQDPALIQQRLQTKLLEKIAVSIGQAANNYYNQPVAIAGYINAGVI